LTKLVFFAMIQHQGVGYMKTVGYYLAIKKSKGYYVPINWGQIPAYEHSDLIPNRLKSIDDFTKSMFNNEDELKAFMVKYADLIDLEPAIVRDKLADITNGFLSDCLMKVGSSIASRTILSKIGNEVGQSNHLKKLLREAYTNVNSNQIKEDLESIFREQLSLAIEYDQTLAPRAKESLLMEIASAEISRSILISLIEYSKNSKPVYDIEKTYPISVIKVKPKTISSKFTETEVSGGVAYISDAPFLDSTMIKMVLSKAVADAVS